MTSAVRFGSARFASSGWTMAARLERAPDRDGNDLCSGCLDFLNPGIDEVETSEGRAEEDHERSHSGLIKFEQVAHG